MMRKIQGWISMSSEHGRRRHELGCHRMQLWIIPTHGRSKGMHASASHHPHASTISTKTPIDSRWEKSSNTGSFFLRFGGKLAVSCLNIFLFKGSRPRHIMKFVVQSTSVAHRLPVRVSPPQSCGVSATIGTAGSLTLGGGQPPFWFDKRSVGSIHFIIKTTSIAEVVTISISSPEGGGGGSTVDTLSTF